MDLILWQKIEQFDLIFPQSEYGFATRLSFENDWTAYFTLKAIEEYKKFMFLAATANQMVSPSEIVDIVWHQHLIFTESYKEFCTILGKKTEHIPSTHNKEEKETFLRAKNQTKKLYEQNFGSQPEEFWIKKTFSESINIEKSNIDYSVVSVIAIISIVVLVFLLRYLLYDYYVSIQNPTFGFLFIIISVVTFFGLIFYNDIVLKKKIKRLTPNLIIDNLTPKELILLKTNDVTSLIHGYVNYLVLGKNLKVNRENKTIQLISKQLENPNPAFKVVLDSFEDDKPIKYKDLIDKLIHVPIINNNIQGVLKISDKISKSKQVNNLFLINISVFSFVFSLGLTRVLIGYIRDKQILYILFLNLIFFVISYLYLNYLITRATKKLVPYYYENEVIPLNKENYTNWEWKYFIYGTALLSTTFKSVASSYISNDYSSGFGGTNCGSSCGSSCGGGCGGGCGGCGS